MVPLFFEFCFIGALAALLITAEQDIKRVMKAKDAMIATYRAEHLALETIALLATDAADQDQGVEVEQLKKLRKRLDDPFVDLNSTDYPELADLMQKVESPKSDLKRILDAGLVAIQDPTLDREHRHSRLRKIVKRNKSSLYELVNDISQLDSQLMEIEGYVSRLAPEESRNFQINLVILVTIGLFGSFAISIFFGLAMVNNIFDRLKIIAQNAQLISFFQPLPAMLSGTDEIAQLDRVLHESSDALNYIRQKESTILDNAASLICSFDSNLRFLEASKSVIPMLQMQPDDVVGMSFLALLRADVVEKTRHAFEQVSTSNVDSEIETIIRRKDKSCIECLCTISWSVTKRQYFCVIHDIAQQKSIERLKQHLVSIVSHDLRAPITSVLLNLGMMMDGKKGHVSERVLKELEKSDQSLHRLMALVNDLLELEKFGLGKEEIEKECISAAEVCKQARESLESLATRSKVHISGPIGDAAILGNHNRLVQVLVNLLSNAIKYSPEDSVVQISLATKNRFVEIGIQDQGPGIPPDERGLIFERFHQGKVQPDGHAKATKSTGLGLAIVKSLVKAHGGECGVECGAEGGSRFWFRVPEFVDSLEEVS